MEFTYKRGTARTYTPEGFFGEIELDDTSLGTVALMTISGNRAINAGDYTASVSLADPLNFVWAIEGGTDPVELPWKIGKQTLTLPTLGSGGTQKVSSVYGTAGLADQGFDYQVLGGFDDLTMGISEMTAGYRVVDGDPAMTAEGVGTYSFKLYLKDANNYRWADDASDVTLVWTVTPATYDMSGVLFERAAYEFTYNGQQQRPSVVGDLPVGLDGIAVTVTYRGGATHVSDGEQTVTAVFSTTSKNYTFADGANKLTATVKILPYEIEEIVWTQQKHFTFNGEDQSASVLARYEAIDGRMVPLALEEVAFTDYREGGYAFTVTGFTAADNRNGNYVLGETVQKQETYFIDKMQVTVAVGDQSAVYTGQAAQLSSVAGSDYLVAADNADVTDFALENGWNGSPSSLKRRR